MYESGSCDIREGRRGAEESSKAGSPSIVEEEGENREYN